MTEEIQGSSAQEADTQPGSAKTVADILTAAADLIDKPGAWTQGAYGRDRRGDRIFGSWSLEKRAVCRCLVGALVVATGDEWSITRVEMADAAGAVAAHLRLPRGSLPAWNDAPERAQAEVVAALREAAAKAAEAGQ